LIALGSNMRVPGVGGPRQVLRAALAALGAEGLTVEAAAPIVETPPLGPSRRSYANGAAVVATKLDPPELLKLLQHIERAFGRKRRGQRWSARPLDLDIVLWSNGAWIGPALVIPHPRFRTRAFVLKPATAVAPAWRDPASGLTLAQLTARLDRSRPSP
jgi:2-amino-4-hydroxy-6-hydroxymethyldihydropteridine diphosphokinase